jgi:hypothetical protein
MPTVQTVGFFFSGSSGNRWRSRRLRHHEVGAKRYPLIAQIAQILLV